MQLPKFESHWWREGRALGKFSIDVVSLGTFCNFQEHRSTPFSKNAHPPNVVSFTSQLLRCMIDVTCTQMLYYLNYFHQKRNPCYDIIYIVDILQTTYSPSIVFPINRAYCNPNDNTNEYKRHISSFSHISSLLLYPPSPSIITRYQHELAHQQVKRES